MTDTGKFKAQKTPHLMDEAYAAIKEGICDGTIEPGAVLSETRIAAELHMSRTPVREALKTLEKEGFLDIRVGIGACVRGLSYRELKELYELRRAMEIIGARTAIYNITDQEIEDLQNQFEDLLRRHKNQETIDIKNFVDIDLALHLLIIRRCDNRYVQEFMDTIMGNVRRIQTASFQSKNDLEESTNQHLHLLELIRAREYEPLAKALGDHMDWSIRCFEPF